MDHLHEGHQGIVKCRALARDNVLWPDLSKQIAEKIGGCSICEKENKYPPEPLRPTKLPDYPWQKVGMDLCILKGHRYLLVIDYYSRIEISHLQTAITGSIVDNCKPIFARYGILEVGIFDNGPQFKSKEFWDFSNVFGFIHLSSSHHYSQGNGEVERAVQTVKNLLKKQVIHISYCLIIAVLHYNTARVLHNC
ncbi:uncharacterized protein K02A2.6-like [Octopus bimaculoides]|uniref:uncharacterized protein K02A2.6-like n=1 Tax=Octopus bimaculoides TaxID=37653 RepID=UPI00071DE1DB|nr:uncharacterized protein K02A2.6-like [Octopus bimaculoides]|eukprot:XP_014768870.1 PREDICTED: uncharacterized protein K02A2.6-like [Octopus bimaculoides]